MVNKFSFTQALRLLYTNITQLTIYTDVLKLLHFYQLHLFKQAFADKPELPNGRTDATGLHFLSSTGLGRHRSYKHTFSWLLLYRISVMRTMELLKNMSIFGPVSRIKTWVRLLILLNFRGHSWHTPSTFSLETVNSPMWSSLSNYKVEI